MNTTPSAATAASAEIPTDASRSVARLLAILAGLVLIIVVWGAVVRLTGSGLSIPDWPLINGSLLPPFSEEGWTALQEEYRQEALSVGRPSFPPDLPVSTFRTRFWIEYLHRAIAAIVGIVLLVAIVKGFRSPAVKAKAEGNLYMLAGLLVAQAGLGGVVVKGAVQGLLVAVHLLVAYLFFGVLIWTALRLAGERPLTQGGSRSAGYIPMRLAIVTLIVLGVQIGYGGLVAGDAKENLISTWPLMFGGFMPPGELLWNSQYAGSGNLLLNPIFAQVAHRWLPIALLVAYAMLRHSLARTPLRRATKMSFRAADGLLTLQIIVGILNVLTGAHTHVSALHSAIALCLFGSLIVVLHDLRYASGESALPFPAPEAAR